MCGNKCLTKGTKFIKKIIGRETLQALLFR